jgi:hypothetical protein
MNPTIWLLYAVFFIAVPFAVHLAVLRLTNSSALSWVAAIIAILVSVFIYARLFERLKHGVWRRGGGGQE